MRGAFLQDCRYALRVARRSPGSTLAACVALTLGIGATTAIFSVVDSVILRPLPIRDAHSVVRLFETDSRSDKDVVSMADFLDWKRQVTAFSSWALFRLDQANLLTGGAPQRVRTIVCDAALLPLLGIAPIRGRNFHREEDEPGHDNAAMLSQSFWESHFGGENVIGRKIILDERPYTVVGILPEGVWTIGDGDVWLPATFDLHQKINTRGYRWYRPVGRLRPGISLAKANSQLARAAAMLGAEFPKQNSGVGAKALRLRDALAGDMRPPLLMLFGAGFCVLLIACGNVANLALTRSSARSREISVRIALGAGRSRLFRQLLTESALLSVAAAVAGLGLTAASIRVLRHLPGVQLMHSEEISIDWRVLAFAIGIGLAAGIGFGLAPAIRASMVDVQEALKQTSGRTTESRKQQRMRQLFISLETAVATLLLIQSALLIKSYAKASEINPGFDTHNVLALHVSLPPARYGYQHPASVTSFEDKLLPGIRSISGIEHAAVVTDLPLLGIGGGSGVIAEGQPFPKNVGDIPYVQWTCISPDYFQTMRTPRIAGRDFNDHDREGSKEVVIVNHSLARQLFGTENPIGKLISAAVDPPQWSEVVGEFGDIAQLGIEKRPVPEVFIPVAQAQPQWLAVVARTSGDPLGYVERIQKQVEAVDPSVAVFLPRTMQQIVGGELGWRVFQTSLVSLFGGLAMVLSCIGIYAVVAYSVAQRTAEIGIRMALGASKRQIARAMVIQGALPALVGALAGAVLSLALSRVFSQLLYGVQAIDVPTYALVVGSFFALALLASYVPARRAAALEPSRCLRYE